MIAQLTAWLRDCLGSRLQTRLARHRYHVTPHQSSFAFRRELLRDIHRELREASSRASRGTSR